MEGAHLPAIIYMSVRQFLTRVSTAYVLSCPGTSCFYTGELPEVLLMFPGRSVPESSITWARVNQAFLSLLMDVS